MSADEGAGLPEDAPGCCEYCWATAWSAGRGAMNASASARGQMDSAFFCSPADVGASARGAAGGGGAKRLLRALVTAGRSAAGASVERLGSSKLLTRPINSCGWKGLRISSSAFTATALSATLLFTTPDISTTGVPPNSGCCLIWLQTE